MQRRQFSSKGERVIELYAFLEDLEVPRSPICRDLGIDADFSNILHDVDGILSGKVWRRYDV